MAEVLPPVSYTHLDVYKRQAVALADGAVVDQLRTAVAQEGWRSDRALAVQLRRPALTGVMA